MIWRRWAQRALRCPFCRFYFKLTDTGHGVQWALLFQSTVAQSFMDQLFCFLRICRLARFIARSSLMWLFGAYHGVFDTVLISLARKSSIISKYEMASGPPNYTRKNEFWLPPQEQAKPEWKHTYRILIFSVLLYAFGLSTCKTFIQSRSFLRFTRFDWALAFAVNFQCCCERRQWSPRNFVPQARSEAA